MTVTVERGQQIATIAVGDKAVTFPILRADHVEVRDIVALTLAVRARDFRLR